MLSLKLGSTLKLCNKIEDADNYILIFGGAANFEFSGKSGLLGKFRSYSLVTFIFMVPKDLPLERETLGNLRQVCENVSYSVTVYHSCLSQMSELNIQGVIMKYSECLWIFLFFSFWC